ncbi:MAG TPA: hypothetical protein PK235_14815 [Phycisphaerae bacterium]|nr:hypothetical protein [Phycisphaerae bacterium]
MLVRITFTGADDSVDPVELLKISKDNPFVEWGILISANNQGNPRYPTQPWIDNLLGMTKGTPVLMSCHVCGRWVRELAAADLSLFTERPGMLKGFGRIQLNFGRRLLKWHEKFPDFLAAFGAENKKQWIIQLHGSDASAALFGQATACCDHQKATSSS